MFKWLLLVFAFLCNTSFIAHPYYVSVTEIEHNKKDTTVEISCKIFTDDFEKTLRATYHTPIDLVVPKNKAAMEVIVNDYIKNNFNLQVNGKKCNLNFLGYEQQQEAIVSFYQVNDVAAVKNVDVANSILYNYSNIQINIIHVTVDGVRQSKKLTNPENNTTFSF